MPLWGGLGSNKRSVRRKIEANRLGRNVPGRLQHTDSLHHRRFGMLDKAILKRNHMQLAARLRLRQMQQLGRGEQKIRVGRLAELTIAAGESLVNQYAARCQTVE